VSYWDSAKQEVVRFDPSRWAGYQGWFAVDCGCCGGLEWGGDSPRECGSCMGGRVALHAESRRLALYPGGPFCGVFSDKEVAHVLERAAL
jgi:hypothetical protein